MTILWLSFLLVFAEEPWSLVRWAVSPGVSTPSSDTVLRVITLNCNVGDRSAAEEAARLKPDIILFQESPGRAQLEALARKFFDDNGGVVHGVDASIVAHGKVVPAELSTSLRSFFVQARVILPSGITVEVISTRLVPAVFRADLWSPSCWRAQAENRRTRRAQLRAIARQIEAIPDGIPVILGGDFNAPQGDAVFRLLKPRLHDGFANAGRGWGDTITNDVPFLRIDQVWTSRELQMVRVVTRKTTHSDHRMVICDMALSHGARRPRTYTRQPPMENSGASSARSMPDSTKRLPPAVSRYAFDVF